MNATRFLYSTHQPNEWRVPERAACQPGRSARHRNVHHHLAKRGSARSAASNRRWRITPTASSR